MKIISLGLVLASSIVAILSRRARIETEMPVCPGTTPPAVSFFHKKKAAAHPHIPCIRPCARVMFNVDLCNSSPVCIWLDPKSNPNGGCHTTIEKVKRRIR